MLFKKLSYLLNITFLTLDSYLIIFSNGQQLVKLSFDNTFRGFAISIFIGKGTNMKLFFVFQSKREKR